MASLGEVGAKRLRKGPEIGQAQARRAFLMDGTQNQGDSGLSGHELI